MHTFEVHAQIVTRIKSTFFAFAALTFFITFTIASTWACMLRLGRNPHYTLSHYTPYYLNNVPLPFCPPLEGNLSRLLESNTVLHPPQNINPSEKHSERWKECPPKHLHVSLDSFEQNTNQMRLSFARRLKRGAGDILNEFRIVDKCVVQMHAS